jgi:myo-inositol 2-dehydrogenase/D-chiro-inositol 1-dehydrogenase
MGKIHASAAQELGALITAVVDSDGTAAGAYSDVRSVPLDSVFDFAVVATPTDLHFQHVADAVARFPDLKGILIEKPPVLTREEIDAIRKFPDDVRARLFVAEVEHYNRSLQAFAKYREPITKLTMERNVDLSFFLRGRKTTWFLDEQRSGGIVLDLMIHDLNLLVAKFGPPRAIARVKGTSTKFSGVDDVEVELEYPGFTALLRASWTASGAQPIRTRIGLTAGTGTRQEVMCDSYLESVRGRTNPFVAQMSAFLSTLRTGQMPYSLSVYLDAVEIALRIRERL